MEQMDIFGFEDVMSSPSLPIVEGQEMLWKWRMLEYLDELKGQTAKVTYQDNGVFYQVPFKFGSLYLSSNAINSRKKDVVALQLLESNKSKMTFNTSSKGCLRALELKDGLHTFHYQREENNVWKPCCSKVMFELTDYSQLSSSLTDYDTNGELSQLIGKTVQAKLRTNKDLIRNIDTLPFKITSIQLEGDQLTIIGTNDTIIRTTGYKGVRFHSELLIDVFHKESGYTQTIHLL